VTREDEGIAIAMGAFMAGRNPALILEASGLGLCPLAIATLAHEQRMACLIVYGHNFALGEVRDIHTCTRWVADPILNALMIPNLIVQKTEDAPQILKQAWPTVRGQMTPVAVCLPLHVLWDEYMLVVMKRTGELVVGEKRMNDASSNIFDIAGHVPLSVSCAGPRRRVV
jgi:sulfopyruvate decarboxylase TPP-binding subunit